MKRIVLLLLMLLSLTANAQGIGDVRFGSTHQEAMKNITALFGQPVNVSPDQCFFTNRTFMGMQFDEVHFNFQKGKLTEARFFKKQKSKHAAKSGMKELNDTLTKVYPTTMDLEDRTTPFYVGGASPAGFGHLFTIFVSPRNGAWSTQLRYGPFKM